jgi:hypothetical protein
MYICMYICMYFCMYMDQYLYVCISGANPTIVFYNASVVKSYNATSSLVRFENKNTFLDFVKTL